MRSRFYPALPPAVVPHEAVVRAAQVPASAGHRLQVDPPPLAGSVAVNLAVAPAERMAVEDDDRPPVPAGDVLQPLEEVDLLGGVQLVAEPACLPERRC